MGVEGTSSGTKRMFLAPLTHASDSPAAYVLLVALILWRLPTFGRRVLAFLRDLRRYRDGD